ncbi:MAG: hypothetical protein RLZZ87_644, partial [Actinomycetota bacterium]
MSCYQILSEGLGFKSKRVLHFPNWLPTSNITLMKIAVCVKQVPDSWAEKKMVNGRLDRESVDAVLND